MTSKKKIGLSIAVFLTALILVAPVASAAAAVTPGSTSTVMGLPVTQAFTGLTASTSYTLYDETGSNSTTYVFVTDSAGAASVTITPGAYGQNIYKLRLTSGGTAVLTFSVDNMDIIPYLLPVIIISVIFTFVAMFRKMF